MSAIFDPAISATSSTSRFFVSCYNERDFIVATLETVRRAMAGLGLTYDIVIIDDGSSDGSPDLISRYIADGPTPTSCSAAMR